MIISSRFNGPFIPWRQIWKVSLEGTATSQILGSHLLLLFAVHGPLEHHAHSLPCIAVSERDSIVVRHSIRSVITLQGEYLSLIAHPAYM